MKGFIIWLISAITIFIAGLIVFGASPSDLLDIPVSAFNSVILKKDAASPDASPSAAPQPSSASLPAGTLPAHSAIG